jgi:hypothetical protein
VSFLDVTGIREEGPDDRYHYLLQSDPDLLSLDDYVLNTGTSALPVVRAFNRADEYRGTPIYSQPWHHTRFSTIPYPSSLTGLGNKRPRNRCSEVPTSRTPYSDETANEQRLWLWSSSS